VNQRFRNRCNFDRRASYFSKAVTLSKGLSENTAKGVRKNAKVFMNYAINGDLGGSGWFNR
jgi:hypothetical protein